MESLPLNFSDSGKVSERVSFIDGNSFDDFKSKIRPFGNSYNYGEQFYKPYPMDYKPYPMDYKPDGIRKPIPPRKYGKRPYGYRPYRPEPEEKPMPPIHIKLNLPQLPSFPSSTKSKNPSITLSNIGSLISGYYKIQPGYYTEPTYVSPEPTYAPPEPTYASLEPTYVSPEPTYASSEPIYVSPEQPYVSSEPTYNPSY